MPITAQMLNGHKTCHGGQLFSLADTAFAYACNSQGHAAVASMCSIDFIRPGFEGDLLTATATMKHQGKRSGLYEVEITNQDGKTLALFHGRSHRLGHRLTGEQSWLMRLFAMAFALQLAAMGALYRHYVLTTLPLSH
nr:hydroxyphenylacetyl-CoA thioesterase PaaI [Providencia rettgeri]